MGFDGKPWQEEMRNKLLKSEDILKIESSKVKDIEINTALGRGEGF